MTPIALKYSEAVKIYNHGTILWRVNLAQKFFNYNIAVNDLICKDPIEFTIDNGNILCMGQIPVIWIDEQQYRYFIDEKHAIYWKYLYDKVWAEKCSAFTPEDDAGMRVNILLCDFYHRHNIEAFEKMMIDEYPDDYIECVSSIGSCLPKNSTLLEYLDDL